MRCTRRREECGARLAFSARRRRRPVPASTTSVLQTAFLAVLVHPGTQNNPSPREELNFHETVYGTAALPLCDEGNLEQATRVELAEISVAH